MIQRKKSLVSLKFFMLFCTVLLMGSLVAGCTQSGTKPASLQAGKKDGLPVKIEEKNLKRGLKAIYFFDKYRHIDEMPKSEQSIAKYGRPGSPILKLDHEFGKGIVFDSGRSQEIGILMTGYIHLDKPGTYLFQAKSNDGFELLINGNLVVSDPKVHGDKLSDPGQFEVSQGGMFPVRIKYFQRKGTATLKLYWQLPGTSYFSIVPSGAYSHTAE